MRTGRTPGTCIKFETCSNARTGGKKLRLQSLQAKTTSRGAENEAKLSIVVNFERRGEEFHPDWREKTLFLPKGIRTGSRYVFPAHERAVFMEKGRDNTVLVHQREKSRRAVSIEKRRIRRRCRRPEAANLKKNGTLDLDKITGTGQILCEAS